MPTCPSLLVVVQWMEVDQHIHDAVDGTYSVAVRQHLQVYLRVFEKIPSS